MPRRLKLTKEDKEWARRVKERDGNQCVICGRCDQLHSHHIIPREIHETKFDINNGITLCAKHHMFNRIISAHNNPLAMFMWMEEFRPLRLQHLKDKMREIWRHKSDPASS